MRNSPDNPYPLGPHECPMPEEWFTLFGTRGIWFSKAEGGYERFEGWFWKQRARAYERKRNGITAGETCSK